MDFSIPDAYAEDVKRFGDFLKAELVPNLTDWYRQGSVPRGFHEAAGKAGWLGFDWDGDRIRRHSALKAALITEALAVHSPGVAVALLAHVDLGLTGLWQYGSDRIQAEYGPSAVRGETLICLGNTEGHAGSDVANISLKAEPADGGWVLEGAKAYVTNGLISDLAVVTGVSDPEAERNRRISMFLVDLGGKGVVRKKLGKQVWIPSDLTRIQFDGVYVPEDHLMGARGEGLQQVLTVFTYSRVPISALTLGTARGAFELALDHAKKRDIFGGKIMDQQAKTFEMADLYARTEAARLALWKACWAMDTGRDFRLESSLAKYLAVQIAREVTAWAADLFGAASVMYEHPIHKFPMDAWASSLGEGTQDVQKLIIFREMMKRSSG